MSRGLVRLLGIAAAVVVLIVTVPGLGSIRGHLTHGNPGWLVLEGCFRLASALSYVALFRAIFAPRMGPRASYRIGMSEVGANALAPAGGASGLAIGGWVLHRAGAPWAWLVERTAEFFVFTSAFNVGAVAVLGWLGAAGLLASPVSPLLSVVPAIAATVAIGAALALIPRLAGLEAKQRRRRVHSLSWWVLELGVALGTGARGAVNLFQGRDLAAIAAGAGYLLFDILTLWAAVRAFGGHIGFEPLGLASSSDSSPARSLYPAASAPSTEDSSPRSSPTGCPRSSRWQLPSPTGRSRWASRCSSGRPPRSRWPGASGPGRRRSTFLSRNRSARPRFARAW